VTSRCPALKFAVAVILSGALACGDGDPAEREPLRVTLIGVDGATGDATSPEVDERLREELRALGYIE
jgi:hypothetical protein